MQQKYKQQQCKKNSACYVWNKSQKANNLFEIKLLSNTNVVYIYNTESSTDWSAGTKRIFKWACLMSGSSTDPCSVSNPHHTLNQDWLFPDLSISDFP